MAYYYQYNFVSPEQIFSNIKEELVSYFSTGVIDDLMFPVYVDKCLRKLGRATYKISEQPIVVKDFMTTLPDNFHAVREAWMTTVLKGPSYRDPSAFYSQASSLESIRLNPVTIGGIECHTEGSGCEVDCADPNCPSCMPYLIRAVYKTTQETVFTYKRVYLLRPGNINTSDQCTYIKLEDNPYASREDSFDIRGNQLIIKHRHAVVHLIYYSAETCEDGVQLVPDNFRILEYVESFIKYKMFESLYNKITDESLPQIERKMQYYKAMCDEAYIMAEVEIKKQTVWEKQRSIKKSLRRNAHYHIAGSRPDKNKWNNT